MWNVTITIKLYWYVRWLFLSGAFLSVLAHTHAPQLFHFLNYLCCSSLLLLWFLIRYFALKLCSLCLFCWIFFNVSTVKKRQRFDTGEARVRLITSVSMPVIFSSKTLSQNETKATHKSKAELEKPFLFLSRRCKCIAFRCLRHISSLFHVFTVSFKRLFLAKFIRI